MIWNSLRLEAIFVLIEGFRQGQHVLIVPIDRVGVHPQFLLEILDSLEEPMRFELPSPLTKIIVLEVQDPKGQYDAFSTISRVGRLAEGL